MRKFGPWAMSICIALIYFGMVKVSLVFSAPQNAFTLFWPANGFLLGVLIVKGFKRLGFAVLLSFLFLISANFFSGKGIAASIGFTLANMAEIASAYFLLTRIRTEKPFLLDPKLTIYFLIVTTFAAALVGGLIGGATVSICFGGGMVGHVVDWVLVDAMGMAVITPAIVAWMSPDCAWNKGRARTLEFLLCFLTISLLCYFIFWNSSIFSSMEIAPKPYLIFPLLLWSAMRFGPRGTATNLLALYGITAWFTIRGAGPFYEVGESQRYMLLTMEPFPFAAALCSLVPAAFIASQIELTRMVRMRDSRFGGLWNSKLIGIYESDLKGQILEANDTFLKMIDRDRSALQNGEIEMFKMATPEYQAGIAQKMELFRATGSIGPMEREWVLKDGKRFFSLVYGSLSEDKTKALVMVLDMTQLREAKSDLHAVESRFKNMFDSNIVGVAIINRDNVFIEANKAFLKLVGYSHEDLVSGALTAESLMVKEDSKIYASVLSNLKEHGKFDPAEVRYRRKDGTLVSAFRGAALLEGKEQSLVVTMDLTQQKENEKKLESAMSKAEIASTAKTEFLAHMSHEIRTPLNGVMGMLSLISDTPLNDTQRSYSQTASQSAAYLLAIIDQVLDYSKLGNGTFELDRIPFRLPDLSEAAFSSIRETAKQKGIRLDFRSDSIPSPLFLGDPIRVQQILVNLVGNAVKFSDQGSVSVSFHLQESKRGFCKILAEVSDQGPGISPEAKEGLFKAFSQGDNSLSRKTGGTGLGLAISKELIMRMGGSIWFESDKEMGSRFFFTLDLEEAPMGTIETAERKGAKLPAGGSVPVWIKAPNILVVDDHPVNLTVASSLLGKLGCKVEGALDGASAIGKANNTRFDAIFMDCQMPELDGFETTERIRAFETPEERVPIIALTAHAVVGIREICLSKGMDDFMTKPFSREELFEALTKWVPHLFETFDDSSSLSKTIPLISAKSESETKPQPMNQIGPIEWKRLEQMDDGSEQSKAIIGKLVILFLDTAEKALIDINQDITKGDFEKIPKALHKLKGSCATIGAKTMSDLLAELEITLSQSGPGHLAKGLLQLEEYFLNVEAELSKRYPPRPSKENSIQNFEQV